MKLGNTNGIAFFIVSFYSDKYFITCFELSITSVIQEHTSYKTIERNSKEKAKRRRYHDIINCKQYYAMRKSKAYPFFLKFSTILMTESIGTAKLKPSAFQTFITLTPIISPSRFTRGPPEFPCSIQMCQNSLFNRY